MKRCLLRVSVVLCALALLAGGSWWVWRQWYSADQFRAAVSVAYRLMRPLNPRDPVIEVAYTNMGLQPLTLRTPGGFDVGLYRGIELLVDSKPAVYRFDHPTAAHVILSRKIEIPKGKRHAFTIRVRDVWQLPADWSVLAVRPTEIHAPSGPDGPAKVKNGSKRFILRRPPPAPQP